MISLLRTSPRFPSLQPTLRHHKSSLLLVTIQTLRNHTLSTTHMEQLPHLPDVERLSPRVIRILGGNPSKFTLQGTNTYLIGTGPKRILLDTGEGLPIWKTNLKKVLDAENASLETIILTHWHHDHTGGIEDALSLSDPDPDPTESNPTPERKSKSKSKIKVYKNQSVPTTSQDSDPENPVLNITDAQIFTTPSSKSTTLQSLYTPGHTSDHMSFLLCEESALFSGDNILGHGTAVFEDYKTYISSLKKMEKYPGFEGRVYPGHGEVVEDGKEKVKEYLEHRERREGEVVGVINREKDGDQGWTTGEIVRVVYAGYPEGLWGAAEGGIRQILGKLEGEGRVRRLDGGRWGTVSGGGGGGKAAL